MSSRARAVVEQLQEDLEDDLQNYPGLDAPRVYIDKKRLETGDKWDPALRESIARSLAVIVILVPTYFDSKYCAIEWAIADDLGQRRLPPAERGRLTCLLPLQLVSTDELDPPNEVRGIQFSDFADLLVWGDQLQTHPKWLKLVKELRVRIFELARLVCTTQRDWDGDLYAARTHGPYQFTWSAPPPDERSPAFPSMKSVEQR